MPQVSTGTNSHSWVSSSVADGHIRYLRWRCHLPTEPTKTRQQQNSSPDKEHPMKIRENDTKHDLAKGFWGERKKIEMRVKLKQCFGGGIRKKKKHLFSGSKWHCWACSCEPNGTHSHHSGNAMAFITKQVSNVNVNIVSVSVRWDTTFSFRSAWTP